MDTRNKSIFASRKEKNFSGSDMKVDLQEIIKECPNYLDEIVGEMINKTLYHSLYGDL
ncbi:hypothetical protein RhiirB3_443185 [Rhizophagus irregularis]|nr:hypothetical protein RhiirB3_443185 [Rhizophagus irregularis]